MESDSRSRSGADGLSDAIIARFWAKVNRDGPIPLHRPALGSCWLWTTSTNNGYGQFTLPRVNGIQPHVYAHRLAFELEYGPITAEQPYICHACDQPLCCRPSHLFAGTQYDNLTDARRKGRLNSRRPRTATFTPEQRLAIFELPARPGLVTELAKQYGVSKACISKIRHGWFARTPVPAGERAPHLQLEIVPFRQLPILGEVA